MNLWHWFGCLTRPTNYAADVPVNHLWAGENGERLEYPGDWQGKDRTCLHCGRVILEATQVLHRKELAKKRLNDGKRRLEQRQRKLLGEIAELEGGELSMPDREKIE